MAIDFTSDIEFEHHQRAELSDTVRTPGFRHIQRIFDAEVQKFFFALMNLPSGDDGSVVEGHRVAKTAAQLWEGAASRINSEVTQFISETAAGKPLVPVDITEDMIDLGPAQTTQQSFEEETELEY